MYLPVLLHLAKVVDYPHIARAKNKLSVMFGDEKPLEERMRQKRLVNSTQIFPQGVLIGVKCTITYS